MFSMPEVVVSDSSPLINLFLIGRFRLLQEFYPQILIPPAVYNELIQEGKEGTSFFQHQKEKEFLKVVEVKPTDFLKLLHHNLDEGEAEAIALALDCKADLLFLDEKEARSIAREYELRLTGVIGILLRAKLERRIPTVKNELNLLRMKGFWIGKEIYEKVLQEAGE